jgi:hypothetical protein
VSLGNISLEHNYVQSPEQSQTVMDMDTTLAMLNEGREEMKMYRYKNQDLI